MAEGLVQHASATKHVSNLTKEQVDAYAERAARVLGLKPGGDIAAVVGKLGGRIHYVNPFEEREDENSIVVHKPWDFDIYVSQLTSLARCRFTIAHELGHYLLHSKQGKIPLIATRSGTNRAEWEANWFAAGLLMPISSFKQAYKKDGLRGTELEIRFGVSATAVEIRAKTLGLMR